MARDYGRNRPVRRGNNGSKQFLMVLLAFLIGYLTASIFDFVSLTHWINTKLLAQQSNNTVPTAQTATKQAALPKPKFEFYTLLANGRTATPTANSPAKPTVEAKVVQAAAVSSVQPVQLAENKPITNIAQSKESFIIQVGSFKTHPEAERMKAALILKGYSVNIVPTTQGKLTWYRIIIGPYASHADAQKVQAAFARSEHVTGMIRKSNA